MKLIICIDERGGMLFNGRRVSRDRVVCDDVLTYAPDLLIRPVSAVLFPALTPVDDFDSAAEDDFCFVEDVPVSALIRRAKSVTVYNWNRHYPSDVGLDVDLTEEGFVRQAVTELTGYSHEKITREIYVK